MNDIILKDRLEKWVRSNHDTHSSKFCRLNNYATDGKTIEFEYSAQIDDNKLVVRECRLEIAEDGDWINFKNISSKNYSPNGEAI